MGHSSGTPRSMVQFASPSGDVAPGRIKLWALRQVPCSQQVALKALLPIDVVPA